MVQPTTRGRGLDQRGTLRRRVLLTARYASANLSLEGYVTDLSADGVFFNSQYLDDQGELVQLSIDLPMRPAPLELRAEVRWVSDGPYVGGMGLRLIDVSLEDRALLANLADVLAGGARVVPEGNA